MAFIPMKDDGEPVSNQEEFEALSKERKKALEKNREKVQRSAREMLKQQQAISRKVQVEVKETVRKFAAELIEPLLKGIASRYQYEGMAEYMEKVQAFILENLEDFRKEEEEQPSPFPFAFLGASPQEKFLPYQVNLLVDNSLLNF